MGLECADWQAQGNERAADLAHIFISFGLLLETFKWELPQLKIRHS